MAFPFPNVPIKDQLASSVLESIGRLGAEVRMEYTVMDREELQAFLEMEAEGWTRYKPQSLNTVLR